MGDVPLTGGLTRMLHLHNVSRLRRHRLGALVLATLLAAGCTDSDVNSSESKQHTATTTTAASDESSGSAPATTASTGESAGESTSEADLPQLDDVATAAWEPETRTDELAVEIGETDLTPQQAV